jgi:hypothetical protein
MPIPLASPQNSDPVFYLIGDEVSTAQSVTLDSKWKLEDVKRAVGAVFHVAQPMGMCFYFLRCRTSANNIRLNFPLR